MMKFFSVLVIVAATAVVGLAVCADRFDLQLGASGASQVQKMVEYQASGKPVINADNLVPIEKSDDQWRHLLTDEQFYVTRLKGTEPPGSGRYWDNKSSGTYRCVCCDLELFDSGTKFESGTGWPSFFQPIHQEHLKLVKDNEIWYQTRIEVLCRRCNAHLGHVFPDGPQPTGLRYCLNSTALEFEGRKSKEGKKE